ncbi:MAG: IPT/TIG domain-containing protein [Bacteroidales bacterium]|nr:IPT/TIG domain-containing protein [Bacteroidales bacterium]
MKRINKISAIICAAAFALGITSCTVKELDTNQYSDTAVTLASFGPNPVMRGAQLRFFGSNLQNISEVNVPGVGAITNIEVVTSGKTSEIRVTLPVEGPEIGYVTLKSKDGQEFKTRSELTYQEPIVFDGFTAPEIAYPGDVITLKGDYMQLVQSVTFEGGENVPVLEGSTRHEAKVVVPATAVTGKIILSDGGEVENLFYSENDLVIGKPSVTKSAKKNVKVSDELTVNGQHLEMISYFTFQKGEATEVVDVFNLAEDNASITVAVPSFATDGAFTAVSFAGDEFAAGEIACIMPSALTVKNTPKAGQELLIDGKDLDVVTRVDFNGAESADFTYDNGSIKATVPAVAKAGDAVLYHANGNSVTVAYSLVMPTITSVAPLELYAGDEPVKVSGTNLDLAVKAYIGGKEVEISAMSATELTLATAVTSVGGVVTLELANGEKVSSEQEVTMKYHSKVIVTSIPEAQHIGQEVVIKGSNLNLVETIYIGSTKVTSYSIRKDDEIRFLMPWMKVGSYSVNFVLYDGDTEVQPNPINVQLEQNIVTIWEGSFKVGGWAAGMQDLAWGGYDWSQVKAGTELIIYYSLDPDGDYHQMRAGNGSWAALPSWKQLPGADGDGNVPLADGSSYLSIKLTKDDLVQLTEKGGLVICAAWFIVEKVVLISDIPQEKTIWSGSFAVGGWANGMQSLAWGGYDWSTVEEGTKLILHYEYDPAMPEGERVEMRCGNGSWAALPSWKTLPGSDGDGNVPLDESGEISITLTADDLVQLTEKGGLVVCAKWFILTGVGLL